MKRTTILFTLAVLQGCGGGQDAADAAAPDPAAAAPARLVQGSYTFDGLQTKSITFEDRDGWAYWQGDIILGRTADLVSGKATAQNAHPQGDYVTNQGRWLNGVLLYDAVNLTSGTRTVLRDAIRHVSLLTPVRFSRDPAYASYTRVYPTELMDVVKMATTTDPRLGGSSMVGRVGGAQAFYLNTTLSGSDGATTAAHELTHALGAWHEQSRSDRDSYVRVNPQNVDPSMLYNFDMHLSDGATHGGYDYCSAMHYPRYAFSINNLPTIEPLYTVSCQVNPVAGGAQVTVDYIGQRLGLSTGDAAMLNFLYGSAPAGRPIADAGDDQLFVNSVLTVTTVQLNGSASRAVPGASIVKYYWRPADSAVYCTDRVPAPRDCLGNPIANYASPTASVTQYRDRMEDRSSRKYRLTVTDSAGRVMSDVVTVTMSRY